MERRKKIPKPKKRWESSGKREKEGEQEKGVLT